MSGLSTRRLASIRAFVLAILVLFWIQLPLRTEAVPAISDEPLIEAANVGSASTGSISGHVYQSDGVSPICGATVYCVGVGNLYLQSTTDTFGSYKISDLPSGNYYIYAQSPDYLTKFYGDVYNSFEAILVNVNAPADSPNINIILDKGGSISGHVYQFDGITPISNAKVSTSYGRQDTTISDGSYHISMIVPGSYVVKTDAAGYITTYYKGVYDSGSATQVVVTRNNETQNIDFAMDTGGSISGYVYQADGTTPIAGASVFASPLDRQPTTGQGITASDGSYSLTGLFSGNYVVKASASGYITKYYKATFDSHKAAPVGVTVHNDTPGVDLILEAGASISGHVYAADGLTPNPHATVLAYLEAGDYYYMNSKFTDDNGAYTITTLPPGYYSIRADSPGYVTQYYDGIYSRSLATLVEVGASGTTTLGIDFKLNYGGSISGKVTRDDDGSPVPNAYIFTQLIDEGSNFSQPAYSTSSGDYLIPLLVPGKYKVQITANGYISQNYNGRYGVNTFNPVRVSVNAETTNINFVLDTGGSISGRVFEDDGVTPIQGASIFATSSSGQSAGGATTDKDGKYVMSTLLAGTYLIKAQAKDYPSMYFNGVFDKSNAVPITVSYSANITNVNFNLKKGGSLSGHVYKADGTTILSNAYVSIRPAHVPSGEGYYYTYQKVFPDSGSYTFTGLAPGDYEVFAAAPGYIKEYYGGAYSSRDANLVNVSLSANVTGIDFSLDIGGSISGYVYQGDGITPIANATVGIPIADINAVSTAADGSYTINGLASGNYSIFAYEAGYLSEYYDGAYYSGNVTRVNVVAPNTTAGIDFSLDKGGSISGHVRGTNGISAISSVFHVVADPRAMGIRPPIPIPLPILTDPPSTVSGAYKIQDLPPRNYKVYAIATGYITEYYEDVSSAGEARLVQVNVGSDTPNINFDLDMCGDANGNGVIGIGDITKMERIILGLDLPTPGADANGDGQISMADIIRMERIILGFDQ